MKRALLACVIATLGAGVAWAQQPQISPQVRQQMQTRTLLQPTPRQLELLRAAGVPDIGPTLRASTTVTVRNPVAEFASLHFEDVQEYDPEINAIGSAVMQGVLGANPGEVRLHFRAEPNLRYIVDCRVQGPDNAYRFRSRLQTSTGPRDEEITVTVSGGRAGIVIQPVRDPARRWVTIQSNGRHLWQFNACDVTPVG